MKRTKTAAQLDREIAAVLSRPSFPLHDAKLAVDVTTLRDQLSQLCERLRYDTRAKSQAVLVELSSAQDALGDAIAEALKV